MKLLRLALVVAVVAGCSPASPRFAGADPVPVTVDGFQFDIYLRPGEAQAVRTNSVLLPDPVAVRRAGLWAIASASGCIPDPDRAKGDVAIFTAPIKCPDV